MGCKASQAWRAHIVVDGKQLHLGTFDCPHEAGRVRAEYSKKYGFHPNHGKAKGL